MRLFIAIELPDEIKKALGEVQSKIRNSGIDARWTRPEGFHATLKFLGEVAESRVPEIMNVLSGAVKNRAGFQLTIAGAGAFPNPRNARVVWLGLSGETEKLARLQATVEEAMTDLGFKPEDRAFTPHLTIGRIKFIRQRDEWLKALDTIKDITLSTFDVHAVSLIKSELKPAGALYTELCRVELKQD